ncbi:DUF1282 family protein [Chromobacterium alkanivorans]|uniref:YIP1 family protein n=1 Tax=Chromobacterium alkanivorans TaxID=1071719 RepID=UPI0019686DF3|nr:YIP1 family protein [Chromobacterium alkanivorans]MBN3003598.1 DUF1282 family protein [Chromobacterium alkanivorans]
MKLSHYPKMLFSSHGGWDELRARAPTPRRLMLKLVLPFSLLPALMICYAGLAHGQLYAPAAGLERWLAAAALFFVAELATVPLMAWTLQALAAGRKLAAGFDQCFLLAAGAAVPLWLSSLALLAPDPAFNLLGALLGLAASFALLYHGLPAILGLEEEVESQHFAYSALCAGAAAWALLLALALLPLFGGW